jgi:RNA 2',3'-cyclic 3'-phosphodiesterase
MRIFIALDIDEAIRERIKLFIDGVRGFVPEARWVRPESLHVTLKFVGSKSAEDVEKIKLSLGCIQGGAFDVSFRGYGFFPTSKSPRVFWLGVLADSQLGSLAKSVDENMAELGVPEEEHAFSPHLTLARRGSSGAAQRLKSDVPNSSFQQLQKRLSAMAAPDFGTMTAREFFLYESQLGRGGSRYTKIARFELS